MSYSLQAGCKEGVQTGNVAVLGGHSIGHSKQQTVYVHVFYSERFLWKSYFIVQEVGFGVLIVLPSLHTALFRFSFMGLDEEWSAQNKVDNPDNFLNLTMHVIGSTEHSQYALRQATRHALTIVRKGLTVESEIF